MGYFGEISVKSISVYQNIFTVFIKCFIDVLQESQPIGNLNTTKLLVSGRSPECSDCLLRFMEQL